MRPWHPDGESGHCAPDTMGDGTPSGHGLANGDLARRLSDPQPSSRHHHARAPPPPPPVPSPPPRKRRSAARAPWPRNCTEAPARPTTRAVDAMRVDGERDGAAGGDVDVDMGTPTAAATNSLSDWREAVQGAPREDDDARWRIHVADRHGERDGASSQTEPAMQVHEASHASSTGRSRQQGTEGDSSGDERVVEIQAFREYSHDDIDSLDILPSQDFVGELRDDTSTVRSTSQPHSNAWLEFRDGTEFHEEEASEVFDNVIYAPPKLQSESVAPSTTMPSPNPLPIHHKSMLDDQYESESELSDGYDVPCAVFSADRLPRAISTPSPQPTAATVTPAPSVMTASQTSSASGTPPHTAPPQPQWCARMSVKRDCSFIDETLKLRRKQLSVQDLSESGEEFEEKLKLVDGDEDPDTNAESDDNAGGSSTTKSLLSSSSSSYSISTSAATGSNGLLLPGFRPKKKRRKVRQLALDAFLKVQPGTTY